jgi:phosphohistidine phosphatase SixA
MQVILIRHAERLKTQPDKCAELSDCGRRRTRRLAAHLRKLNVVPTHYFSSRWEHAKQTAAILAADHSPAVPRPVIEVDALTPEPPEDKFSLENIEEHARANNVSLAALDTVAFVGHESRLSQLVARFTGRRVRPLDQLDAVCVQANSLTDLHLGRGEVAWRIPVRVHMEEHLRGKLHSKTTVAALLAGFNATALVEILTGDQPQRSSVLLQSLPAPDWFLSLIPWLPVVILSISLALFISAVYIYDHLSMPEGFWGLTRAVSYRRLPRSVRRTKDQHGMVYAYMPT